MLGDHIRVPRTGRGAFPNTRDYLSDYRTLYAVEITNVRTRGQFRSRSVCVFRRYRSCKSFTYSHSHSRGETASCGSKFDFPGDPPRRTGNVTEKVLDWRGGLVRGLCDRILKIEIAGVPRFSVRSCAKGNRAMEN